VRWVWVVIPLVLFGIVGVQEGFSQYIVETHFFPSEWSDAVQITVHEYVNDVLIQNKTILQDSIKIRISGGLEDVLPPNYSVRILYDIIDNKIIQHIESTYEVDFGPLEGTYEVNSVRQIGSPENANLVKTSEMEYKPPKKIAYGYDLENEQIANIKYQMIMCRQGFEKIMKETTGDTVCVKPETAKKLIQRGWAMEENEIIPKPIDATKNLVYIPSNITKANSNLIQGSNNNFWKTLNIEDVKDDVAYTIRGTVVSIGDNIVEWDNNEVMLYVDNGKNIFVPMIYGFIPITITVQDVYKGDYTDETFTFYLQSTKQHNSDKYELFSHAPDFEINDDILVHLAKVNEGPFEDGFYLPIFGKHSTYQIIDNLGFNERHSSGISINSIVAESIEISDERIITHSTSIQDLTNFSSSMGDCPTNWPVYSIDTPSQVRVGEEFQIIIDYSYTIPDIDAGYEDPDDIFEPEKYLEFCLKSEIMIRTPSFVKVIDQRYIAEGHLERWYTSPPFLLNEGIIPYEFDNTGPQQEIITMRIDPPRFGDQLAEIYITPGYTIGITRIIAVHDDLTDMYETDTELANWSADDYDKREALLAEIRDTFEIPEPVQIHNQTWIDEITPGYSYNPRPPQGYPPDIDEYAEWLLQLPFSDDMRYQQITSRGFPQSYLDNLFEKYPELLPPQ